ncbi:MAG TPA: hypothetical protein VM871_10385 [Flavisolibacter sp.]|jgi:hypothetical protein|nr:hypothetical protein [Flavisolibacter sp.]
MMRLEMYVDGQLVDASAVFPPLLRGADYLQTLITELEKNYAAVLSKLSVKPVYVLSGVPSCINSFVPLCTSQVSQLTNTPMHTTVPRPHRLKRVKETSPEKNLPAPVENKIPSFNVTAA